MNEVLAGTIAAFAITDVYFERGTDSSSGAADLTPAFADPGFEGAISYSPRKMIDADHAMYDDVLTIMIPRSEHTYSTFLVDPFPRIAEAFESYRATVSLDEDLDLSDFDRIIDLSERTGRDVDGRDGVFRISPANVFDDELCMRAFGMSAAQVVQHLESKTEVARLAGNKAFFIVTSRLVDKAALVEIDRTIKAALTNSHERG